MRHRVRRCVSAATWLAVTALGVPAAAETRALLVAVTEYSAPGIPDLEGPVNDLAAMEALLRAQGATDIQTLADAGATRTSIETAIHALGLRSKPGDWLVVYFSGHGAQAQAAQAGDEDDGLDEFLVLSGLNLEAPDPEQYVTDNDFHAWFARYVPAEVDILQIADACHSGTLNRSIDPRAWRFTPRLAAYRGNKPLELSRPAPRFAPVPGVTALAGATGESTDLPNVVFIGAAQDDQLALEASLPTEASPSRGLLTYSFEQALTARSADGAALAADSDRDGALSVGELGVYLDSQTRALTGSRQWSSTRFTAGRDRAPLFRASRASAAAPAPAAVKPAIFAADAATSALLVGQPAWTVAGSAQAADFVWDRPAGLVLRRTGDVVARDVSAIPALRGVVEKWATVESLRPLLSEGAAQVVVGPKGDGARYEANARVNVAVTTPAAGEAAAAERLYVTVFNLAADGEVQTLYPLAEDGEGRAPPGGGAIDLLTTEAVAPFGADHVLAVVTPQRPDTLRNALRTGDRGRGSAQIALAVRAELARGGPAASLSVGELYTGPGE